MQKVKKANEKNKQTKILFSNEVERKRFHWAFVFFVLNVDSAGKILYIGAGRLQFWKGFFLVICFLCKLIRTIITFLFSYVTK